jgi:hypothetical protein
MYNDMVNVDHLFTYSPTHPSTFLPTYLPTHPPTYLLLLNIYILPTSYLLSYNLYNIYLVIL